MTVRPILAADDSRLLKPAHPVTEFGTPELRELVVDLIDTMRAAGGQGIAAPQIGVPLRVVVFGVSPDPRYPGPDVIPDTVLINPEVTPVGSETKSRREGCLSIPGRFGIVPRYERLRYRGYDQFGVSLDRTVSGVYAQLVQHECDHLNGILYPTRMPAQTSLQLRDNFSAHDHPESGGFVRWAGAFKRLLSVVQDELLLAWTPKQNRLSRTIKRYSRDSSYLPGGKYFEQGLFDWELAAFSEPPFPQRGCILVGGAGGGREVRGLHQMEYQTVAFEPSPALARACEAFVDQHPEHRFFRGAYADLIRAATRGDGPLASLGTGRFDGVVLGWGSFSHVDPVDRISLLTAVRGLAPTAPLLLSYLAPPSHDSRGRLESLRLRLRALLANLGAQQQTTGGEAFFRSIGFVYWMDSAELRTLAAHAGFKVVRDEPLPYPHAVLLPIVEPEARSF